MLRAFLGVWLKANLRHVGRRFGIPKCDKCDSLKQRQDGLNPMFAAFALYIWVS